MTTSLQGFQTLKFADKVKSIVEKGFEPNSQFGLFHEIFQPSSNDSPNTYQSALLKEGEFTLRTLARLPTSCHSQAT